MVERFKRFKCFRGLRPGKRQAWTPIRSHWSGLGVAFETFKGWQTVGLNANKKQLLLLANNSKLMASRVGRAKRMVKRFKRFKGFKRFSGLRPGKRQAWTPWEAILKWPWPGFCLRGWAFQEAFEAFEALRGWQTASLNAHRSHWSGLGVVMWPWGSFCLHGWALQEVF